MPERSPRPLIGGGRRRSGGRRAERRARPGARAAPVLCPRLLAGARWLGPASQRSPRPGSVRLSAPHALGSRDVIRGICRARSRHGPALPRERSAEGAAAGPSGGPRTPGRGSGARDGPRGVCGTAAPWCLWPAGGVGAEPEGESEVAAAQIPNAVFRLTAGAMVRRKFFLAPQQLLCFSTVMDTQVTAERTTNPWDSGAPASVRKFRVSPVAASVTKGLYCVWATESKTKHWVTGGSRRPMRLKSQ